MTVSELIEELRKYPGDMPTAVELERNKDYADIKVRCMRLIDNYKESGHHGLYIDTDMVVIGSIY